MKTLHKPRAIKVVAAIIAGAWFTSATAQTVIEEWGSAKLPTPRASAPG